MVWPGVEKLTVISGGRTIGDSSELLGSPGMATLVEDMKNRYADRYVLFDVAPVLAGADAISLAPLVDHIVFIVEAEPDLRPGHRMCVAAAAAGEDPGLGAEPPQTHEKGCDVLPQVLPEEVRGPDFGVQ